jgi:hypothetical protein
MHVLGAAECVVTSCVFVIYLLGEVSVKKKVMSRKQTDQSGMASLRCSQCSSMKRAKKMVAICTNSRAQKESDFAISLSVFEGD